jgi:hypothetical protein
MEKAAGLDHDHAGSAAEWRLVNQKRGTGSV